MTGGEIIYTIGSPLGLENTISNGIISNPAREDFYGYIQITAPISSGSSGGPLLNPYGEVVGITTGTLDTAQNLNFAIPIAKLTSVVQGSMQTLSQVARDYEYYQYTNISEILKNNYDESEPNEGT